jgi:hypothetical protein
MQESLRDELLDRLEHTQRYTLNGGNDPEDPGDVKQAVSELCDLIRHWLMACETTK